MFARGLLLTMLLLTLWPVPCPAGVAPVIPEQLKPWTEWVLYDHEEQQFCTPTLYRCRYLCSAIGPPN